MPSYNQMPARPSARAAMAQLQRQKPEQDGIKITPGIIAGVVVILAILGGVIWNFTREGKEFHAKGSVVEIKRDAANDSVPQIKTEDVFSEKQVYSLRDGDSLAVLLTTFHDPKHGYGTYTDTFKVDPWRKLEETTNPERRAYIDQKQEEFKKHLAAFLGKTPKDWVIEVYVDDSEGVDTALSMQVRDALDDVNIPALVDKGDGVKVYFGRISSTDYLDRRRIIIPQGSKWTAFEGEVNEARDWLLRLRGDQKETSLATGLFNALKENVGARNRIVLVFSDGLENTPEKTVSFYKKPGLVEDTGKWSQTDSLLTRFPSLPVPDLTGARVQWFGPQTGRNDVLIRAALRYWQHLLLETGRAGEVKTHY